MTDADRLAAHRVRRGVKSRRRPSMNSRKRRRIRALLIERDGACVYCGRTDELTIDHVTPLCEGGTHDMSNLVLACADCNGRRNREWYERRSAAAHGDDP